MTNEQKMAELAKKIQGEVLRSAGKGLNAARLFLVARIKETISVPAPRKLVSPPGGTPYYRATTPATVGAPIRKLSGRTRSSVTSTMVSETEAEIGTTAKSDKGFNYPRYHEEHDHAFLLPTLEKYLKEVGTILGQEIRLK